VTLYILFISTGALCQVPNDNIEDRLALQLNRPVTSNTIGSTVQWNCLNQDLTRTCVKYHNDQWFEFQMPPGLDELFINIANQDCKDIWGVQLLVFRGIPCEPETYELVTCYSEGTRDDIFIRLSGLEAGENYLVNVDGYLHDLCNFQLEVSDQPRGLPVNEPPVGTVMATTAMRNVRLTWEVPQIYADDVRLYEVWRKTGDFFELIAVVDHLRNAFGAHQLSYGIQDSLSVSVAEYNVIAAGDDNRINVGEVSVKLDEQSLSMAPENLIDLDLSFDSGDPISLELWDVEGDRLLKTYNFTFDPERNARVSFRIMEYRQSGISFYKVVIRNNRTGEFDLQFFEK